MTAKPTENRTGKLDNDKDYVVAFRRLVDDFNRLVRAFNSGTTETISFSEIEETPDTLEGYGITDAAKKKHKHAVSDILGLGVGGGTPGADGDKGDKGDPGERGLRGLSVLGLDGRNPEEPVMIPGRRGIQGTPGAAGASGGGPASHEGVLAFGAETPEPIFIGPPKINRNWLVYRGDWQALTLYRAGDVVHVTGRLYRAVLGSTGIDPLLAAGGEWYGLSGINYRGVWDGAAAYYYGDLVKHRGIMWFATTIIVGPPAPEVGGDWDLFAYIGKSSYPQPGVLEFGSNDYKEPAFGMGIPGRDGLDGSGFVPAGQWDPTQLYFETDTVYWKGYLWWTKFGEVPGDEPGVAGAWLQLLPIPRGPMGPPSLEVARPLEPIMIPGRRGATGAAGSGGGGGDPAYAPGSFTLTTGTARVMVDRLELSGAQEVSLEGDSTLVII